MTLPASVGVLRGPSPPLLSFVPASPPPWYFAGPRFAVHFSFPVAASRATSTSSAPFPSMEKHHAPLTTNDPKPVPPGTFQSTFGAAGHCAGSDSVVEPSPFGPRYCGQSAAVAERVIAARGMRARSFMEVRL